MRCTPLPQAGARITLLLGALLAAPLAGACAQPIVTHTATNPRASFEAYQTFSLGPVEGPPRGYETSARTADVDRRITPILAAALVQRGYASASDPKKADFFIMFGSGRRVVAEQESSAVAQDWAPDDESADFVEGSLVVDAFDMKTRGKVWHGVAHVDVDPGGSNDALLTRAITDLFRSFPMHQPPAP